MQVSQVNDVSQYPVTTLMASQAAPASTKLTARPDDRPDDSHEDDGAVVAIKMRRLEPFALDQFGQLGQLDPFSVMETATSEMALTQTTFEECQKQLSDKVLALVRDNGALGQQLVVAQSHEREISRVHAQQVASLEAQNASLKQQMAKLAADKEAEIQRLQNMLKVAEQQKTTDLATAKATWEQHKAQLNQQNSNLQSQLQSVSSQRDSLQAQVNGEPQRQKAAVDESLARVKAKLEERVDRSCQASAKVSWPIEGYYKGFTYGAYKSGLEDIQWYIKYQWDQITKK